MGDLRQVPLTTLCYVLITIHAGMCLAVSACYEFIEWFAALIGGGDADAFLGTQGDVWDTQWDMFLALIGAITAQLLLSRLSRPAVRPGAAGISPPAMHSANYLLTGPDALM